MESSGYFLNVFDSRRQHDGYILNVDRLPMCLQCATTVPRGYNWVHWSPMDGFFVVSIGMCPLNPFNLHYGIHFECTQIFINGYIVITWCQCPACVPNVPTGYSTPCPQCYRLSRFTENFSIVTFLHFLLSF